MCGAVGENRAVWFRFESRSKPGKNRAEFAVSNPSYCRSVSDCSTRLLFGNERLHALAGVADHFGELRLVENLVLGGRLHFDELVPGRHDKVHVDVGAGVFFVGEIEQNFSVDNSHADGSDEIFERERKSEVSCVH